MVSGAAGPHGGHPASTPGRADLRRAYAGTQGHQNGPADRHPGGPTSPAVNQQPLWLHERRGPKHAGWVRQAIGLGKRAPRVPSGTARRQPPSGTQQGRWGTPEGSMGWTGRRGLRSPPPALGFTDTHLIRNPSFCPQASVIPLLGCPHPPTPPTRLLQNSGLGRVQNPLPAPAHGPLRRRVALSLPERTIWTPRRGVRAASTHAAGLLRGTGGSWAWRWGSSRAAIVPVPQPEP